MSAVSSKTTMPAWPISPSFAGEGLVVERRVEQLAREIGAERPADLHRLDRTPGRGAAADLVDDLASVRPKAVSKSPPCLTFPAIWTGMVPRERPMPKSR
jgi:hypothetical protein